MEIKILAPMLENGDNYDLPAFAQYCTKHTKEGASEPEFVNLAELASNKRVPTNYRIWIAEVNDVDIDNIEALPDTLILPDTGNGNSDAAAVHSFLAPRVSRQDFIDYSTGIRPYSERAAALIDAVRERYQQ